VKERKVGFLMTLYQLAEQAVATLYTLALGEGHCSNLGEYTGYQM
jgi:hypothetical protein